MAPGHYYVCRPSELVLRNLRRRRAEILYDPSTTKILTTPFPVMPCASRFT